MFLRNHDELDLGRLTKAAARDAVFAAFGPDKSMQLYDRGIRRRLAPMLGGDRRRIELAYSLMFTLPGTPVIRYGDELGMGDDLRSARAQLRAHADAMVDRAARAASPRATSPSCRSSTKGPTAIEHVNAAEQRRDPNSMLNWTERIIRMRKEVPEIGWGDFKVIATGDPRGAGAALRLAQQFGAVRAQSRRRRRARSRSRSGLPEMPANCWSTCSAEDHSRADEAAGTRVARRRTAIAGTASAGSIICSSAAMSM